MRVIATDVGYDGVNVKQPGDEFEAPLGAPDANGNRVPVARSTWYKPVAVDHKPEHKPDHKGKGGHDSLV